MQYIREKYSHLPRVIDAINTIESNGLVLDIGMGGLVIGIIDTSINENVTLDNIDNYPDNVQNAIFYLNEMLE